jgi:hypothetical protein
MLWVSSSDITEGGGVIPAHSSLVPRAGLRAARNMLEKNLPTHFIPIHVHVARITTSLALVWVLCCRRKPIREAKRAYGKAFENCTRRRVRPRGHVDRLRLYAAGLLPYDCRERSFHVTYRAGAGLCERRGLVCDVHSFYILPTLRNPCAGQGALQGPRSRQTRAYAVGKHRLPVATRAILSIPEGDDCYCLLIAKRGFSPLRRWY